MPKINTRMYDKPLPDDNPGHLGTSDIRMAATLLCYADGNGLGMKGYHRRRGEGRVTFYFGPAAGADATEDERNVAGDVLRQLVYDWANDKCLVEPKGYHEFVRLLKALVEAGKSTAGGGTDGRPKTARAAA